MIEDTGDMATKEVVEDRLYAGKFKTIEELERGYKESLPVHLKNKELEGKLNEIKAVPTEYMVPVGVELPDGKVKEIQYMSKEAGMNQDQFSSAVKAASIEHTNKKNQLDERMAQLGEQKLNKMRTYLDKNFKNFDEGVKNDLFLKALENPSTMEQIMNDRDDRLNSSMPGSDRLSVTSNPDQSLRNEFKRAAKDAVKDPRDMEAKNRVIELANQLAEANNSGRKYNSM